MTTLIRGNLMQLIIHTLQIRCINFSCKSYANYSLLKISSKTGKVLPTHQEGAEFHNSLTLCTLKNHYIVVKNNFIAIGQSVATVKIRNLLLVIIPRLKDIYIQKPYSPWEIPVNISQKVSKYANFKRYGFFTKYILCKKNSYSHSMISNKNAHERFKTASALQSDLSSDLDEEGLKANQINRNAGYFKVTLVEEEVGSQISPEMNARIHDKDLEGDCFDTHNHTSIKIIIVTSQRLPFVSAQFVQCPICVLNIDADDSTRLNYK
ncbi:hypothetical protein EGR_08604 [Echinococcus granulosus]|uniref:Uncharacterized protein n=1 Tax=Echinococcus granulosus TaxID=6210 RepID=W6U849_ECHGR|nr:hypothetical protein EGR_08604 [Echinococcus granulosus]EUB56531.1 hypothetical protein EGR_08604 [Echinococcus granulosus]